MIDDNYTTMYTFAAGGQRVLRIVFGAPTTYRFSGLEYASITNFLLNEIINYENLAIELSCVLCYSSNILYCMI